MNPTRIAGFILTAFGLLYLLSPAPVFKYYGGSIPPTLDALYAPLDWLCTRVPPVSQAYRLYFGMWDVFEDERGTP
jgi:hypothetical protein